MARLRRLVEWPAEPDIAQVLHLCGATHLAVFASDEQARSAWEHWRSWFQESLGLTWAELVYDHNMAPERAEIVLRPFAPLLKEGIARVLAASGGLAGWVALADRLAALPPLERDYALRRFWDLAPHEDLAAGEFRDPNAAVGVLRGPDPDAAA